MKPVYLLDTNIISESSKSIPNKKVIDRLTEYDGLCAISSTVWQEIIYGYENMVAGRKKSFIGDWLRDVKDSYQILPYDSFAAQICGDLRSRCEKKGKTLPICDSQIAATAIANCMVLITHNTTDFKEITENSMLKIEDWFE